METHPTSAFGVFASSTSLLPLVDQYMSCPMAAAFINSQKVIKPLILNLTPKPVAYSKRFESGAIIAIPERQLSSAKAIKSLSFEIFNVQYKTWEEKELERKTFEEFSVGMDDFATRFEMFELNGMRQDYELHVACQNEWGTSVEDLATRKEFYDSLSLAAFWQEIICHTDNYRLQWIPRAQKAYCAKFPEDAASCNISKKNLCNINEVEELSKLDRAALKAQRLCQRYPHAHEDVKNYGPLQKVVKTRCPNALLLSMP